MATPDEKLLDKIRVLCEEVLVSRQIVCFSYEEGQISLIKREAKRELAKEILKLLDA